MAQMDSRIILAGQQPDFLGTMGRANALAAQKNEFTRQNEVNDFYRQNGAAVAQGDQQALNALAGFSPQEALKIQGQRLGMDATRQNMQVQSEELKLRKQDAKRKAQAWAQRQDAAEVAKVADRTRRGLMAAGAAYEAGDEQTFQRVLQEYGVEPFPMDQFPAQAAQYEGVIEGLNEMREFAQGPQPEYAVKDGMYYDKNNPAAGAQPIPGIPEETATPLSSLGKLMQDVRRGLITEEQAMQSLAAKGETIEVGPDGTMRIVRGGGGGAKTDVSNPSSPAAMIATIDGILSDPALDTSTGILSPLQNIPGTPQKRFGSRARQLEGQAFLQAFESLKGGGQITEIEGQKATQAMGRLDTAQSAADYRQALTELKDILNLAMTRPPGWAEQQSAAPGEIPTISDEAAYNALPSGSMFIAPDGTQRRKP